MQFDGTLRLGHTRHIDGPVWAGGFAELHTYNFDTLEAEIGPQAQLRLTSLWAVQLRAGVGVGTEGTHALVGAQLGTWLLGASVTARRLFDTDETVVSINLEIAALLPILPIALAVSWR